jgi:hypothetical protein
VHVVYAEPKETRRYDQDGCSFVNINTPEQLYEGDSMVGARVQLSDG